MLFEEDDLRRLGKAFDRAWNRFLRTGMLTVANLHLSKEILARRILDAARVGERDEWRLARDAFLHLWQAQFPDLSAAPAAGRSRKSPRRPRN
jgi:hypothetical protein